MTDTIIRNSVPTAPIASLLFVAEYDSSLRVENVVRPVLNSTGHNVTYRPAQNRAGTLALLFATAAHAWAAVALLRTSYTFTLTADVPELSMTFVVRPGDLRPRQAGRKVWTVEVPFQDVT
jgi:hypothetical protein